VAETERDFRPAALPLIFLGMHSPSPATATLSNHTDRSPKKLSKRSAYVAAHREYFDYLYLLLNRAALPCCNQSLPNLTTMAALVGELRELNPAAPWINAVVLGRLLNRVLPGLLRWHGSTYAVSRLSPYSPFYATTTEYRFCEVGRARLALTAFLMSELEWESDHDQWRVQPDTWLDDSDYEF
jgi:hypothetical protein